MAAAEIEPVVRRLRGILLTSAQLFADETVVPVLDPGRGRTKQEYFWAIARDDRPWGGLDPPAVAYTYAPGQGGEHARALLGRYRGILHGSECVAAPTGNFCLFSETLTRYLLLHGQPPQQTS